MGNDYYIFTRANNVDFGKYSVHNGKLTSCSVENVGILLLIITYKKKHWMQYDMCWCVASCFTVSFVFNQTWMSTCELYSNIPEIKFDVCMKRHSSIWIYFMHHDFTGHSDERSFCRAWGLHQFPESCQIFVFLKKLGGLLKYSNRSFLFNTLNILYRFTLINKSRVGWEINDSRFQVISDAFTGQFTFYALSSDFDSLVRKYISAFIANRYCHSGLGYVGIQS